MDRPEVLLLDVNETLSDLSPLATAFESAGAPGLLATGWFASVLRDGFALTVTGDNPDFVALARQRLRDILPGSTSEVASSIDQILGTFRALSTHPDVVPGLRALAHSGIRLATLSNGAADVGRDLLERAGTPNVIETYLSVQDCGRWKPHPDAYAYGLGAMQVDAHEAMLVAVHPWDIHGAANAGLRTAWVDRSGAATYPESFTDPDLQVTSMEELGACLA